MKIIKQSEKVGFDRKNISNEFGISQATITQILKKQKELLASHDSGTTNKQKTSRKAKENDNESQIKHSTRETMLALAQVRSHLQSLGESSQVFDALKSIEKVFIKKCVEESHREQTQGTMFFPVTQLVLR